MFICRGNNNKMWVMGVLMVKKVTPHKRTWWQQSRQRHSRILYKWLMFHLITITVQKQQRRQQSNISTYLHIGRVTIGCYIFTFIHILRWCKDDVNHMWIVDTWYFLLGRKHTSNKFVMWCEVVMSSVGPYTTHIKWKNIYFVMIITLTQIASTWRFSALFRKVGIFLIYY